MRAHTSPQRVVKRARIILLAADGEPSRRIARMVEISEEYVALWRRRFIEERLAGLKDQPRSSLDPLPSWLVYPKGWRWNARWTMLILRRTTLFASILALGALGVTLAEPAGAAQPGCGATITQSTTLTADVGPCPTGDGLIVTGSNLTLDLNHHRVFSGATLPRTKGTDPSGNAIPDDVVGIHLLGASGDTVTGGTVDGFAAGVAIEGGGTNAVRNLTAQSNHGPCVPEIATQEPGKFGDGIVIFSSTDNRVVGNVVQDNAPYSGISIVANTDPVTGRVVGALPSGNTISSNVVRNNALCRAEMGIRVEGPGATHSTVSLNRVDGSADEGIGVLPTLNIDFSVPGCSSSPFNPGTLCPTFNPPQPINQNNLVASNTVTNAGVRAGPARSGIGLLDFFAQQGYVGSSGQRSILGADNNTVQNNSVRFNQGHGIGVNSQRNRILNNVSLNNNQAHCPSPPPLPLNSTPNCTVTPFGGPFTPRYDLYDGNGVIIVPKNPPPPPNFFTPFEAILVLAPGATPCDNNVWSGNVYGTAFPVCTTANGRAVPSTSPSTAALPAASAAKLPRATASAGTSARPGAVLRRPRLVL